MSNAGTDVFCDVLALAGSAPARTPWQQNLILHFCDTERHGHGFDRSAVLVNRDVDRQTGIVRRGRRGVRSRNASIAAATSNGVVACAMSSR